MDQNFVHLRRPRRDRYYFAAGVGLLYWYLVLQMNGPLHASLGAALFVAGMVWLGCRDHVAGMEIGAGRWRVFVGRRHWSVPLGEISAVRVQRAGRDESLLLRCRDGRSVRLPGAVTPNLRALERALASRGIPLEA